MGSVRIGRVMLCNFTQMSNGYPVTETTLNCAAVSSSQMSLF